MRQTTKAYRAECNVEFQRNATQSVARAITDAAHHHASFSKRDVFANVGHRDRFVSRALVALLERAERKGAIRPIGSDVWAVVGEDELCEVMFGHAA